MGILGNAGIDKTLPARIVITRTRRHPGFLQLEGFVVARVNFGGQRNKVTIPSSGWSFSEPN